MIRLTRALQAWGTPDFTEVLKQQIAQLDVAQLPLQQGLVTGNYVADAPITLVVHNVAERDEVIRVKAGIFYQGVLGGCSCADDPTPASDINEYCDVQLDIDKATAETTVTLIV